MNAQRPYLRRAIFILLWDVHEIVQVWIVHVASFRQICARKDSFAAVAYESGITNLTFEENIVHF